MEPYHTPAATATVSEVVQVEPEREREKREEGERDACGDVTRRQENQPQEQEIDCSVTVERRLQPKVCTYIPPLKVPIHNVL